MNTRKYLLLFFILFTSSISFPQAQAGKKPFTIEDLYKIKDVGIPVLSSDGRTFLTTISVSDLETGKSNSDIYLINTDGSGKREIVVGKSADYSPIWSKDGKGVYFTSTRSGVPQLYYIDLNGGETRQITSFYGGINEPVLSPDGNRVAFSAKVFPECGADQKCNKENLEALEKGPLQAHMADRLLFRHWTEYDDGMTTHIFIFDIDNNTYTDITPGEWESPTFMPGGAIGFNFSPDGKEICFMSKRVSDPASSTNADLYLVPVTGGEAKNITSENQAWDGSPVYSPDGRYIAYRTQKIPRYESDKFRIALYDRKAGTTKIITESFDNWIDDFVWSADSKEIYFTGQVEGYAPVYKVNIESGNIEPVISKQSITAIDISSDNKFIIFRSSTVGKPAELYRYDIKKNSISEITKENEELLKRVDIREAEQMWVEGAEGKKVHVFIVKPHGFDPSKKYPLVLNVHGGPQSQWMDSFRGDWQVYPGAGYVVAFPNPHGSTGYGQDYTASISGDWGGKPYEDLMKVTDALEKLPYVDKDRIGAMGWSYGGYMMNWFQAQTKRFKCLVSMMGLYDLESFYGTTEELWFPEYDLKGQPWNSDLYKKWSPSEYRENFSTPTLIITGERDYRVSYTQSLQYFTDLQKQGIDSRLIVFENDGHWPGRVRSMPFYYNAHLDWFHKYLKGGEAPYDMKKMFRNRAFEK